MTATRTTDRESARWDAVRGRAPIPGDPFVYAVKSTGVYCRPGCPSRLANRANVEFFDSGAGASAAGYRACKRCDPDGLSHDEKTIVKIAQACARLADADDAPTLTELAAEFDMSATHFQKVFKGVVGISPKQFADEKRTERFRALLSDGISVTQALYDAGYGTSSRAYESASDRFGMKPSTYKRGGKGLRIHFRAATCYLGNIVVAATDHGICAITFIDKKSDAEAEIQQRFPQADVRRADKNFAETVDTVVDLIETPSKSASLPLDIQGTAFQRKVWDALREIAPGSTASYKDIAQRIGQPTATRAVARACAENKIAVVVPCHRVVRSDGDLSGYRWGVERKRALLDHESETDSAR